MAAAPVNECGRRGPLIDRRPADKAATKPVALGGRRAAGDKWPTAAEDEEARRLMFKLQAFEADETQESIMGA